MSDILDINSQCSSEFGDESDSVTAMVKRNARSRKGRGFFVETSDGLLCSIKTFDKLQIKHGEGNKLEPQKCKTIEGWVIFVNGIHEEANEDDMKELFSEYGLIKNLALNLDRRTGFLKGYAVIEYGNFEDALAAVDHLNDTDYLGQVLKVNWCFTQRPNMGPKTLRKPAQMFVNRHYFR